MKNMVRPLTLVVISVAAMSGSHGTGTPLPPEEANPAEEASQECGVWEDWCKMRLWFFCQKWHLTSTPFFPPPDDGYTWRPENILDATGPSHDLERGWTLDDHHSACVWNP